MPSKKKTIAKLEFVEQIMTTSKNNFKPNRTIFLVSMTVTRYKITNLVKQKLSACGASHTSSGTKAHNYME